MTDQDNDTTIAYYRAAVRQMVLTYPDLDGIGITAGENMASGKRVNTAMNNGSGKLTDWVSEMP